LRDLAGFVVAAQDGDAVWVTDFEGDKEGYGFDGKVAAVDIVTWWWISGGIRKRGRFETNP